MENQPQSNKQYKPISSDFYDELELAATNGQICEIIIRDANGTETKVISRILDLYTQDHVEYARLENQTIRLDQILNLNGKSEGHLQTDLDLLEKDMLPADSAYTQSGAVHTFGTPSDELTNVTDIENTGNTDLTEHGDRSMGMATPTDAVVQGDIHQHERIQDNLLGEPIPASRHTPSEYPVQLDEASDFTHRFTTSVTPFLIAENDYYSFTADRMRNRLYVKVLRDWDEPRDVPEIGGYFSRIAPLMNGTFSLLNDLTGLAPDQDGTLMAPAYPNKDVLLDYGLVKVADLVPSACDTLVHGLHSFSVNSVQLRYFKDRLQAEHWLGDDHREVGTPDGAAS
jgi:transcriptional antiterminator Rof (Rho-off)